MKKRKIIAVIASILALMLVFSGLNGCSCSRNDKESTGSAEESRGSDQNSRSEGTETLEESSGTEEGNSGKDPSKTEDDSSEGHSSRTAEDKTKSLDPDEETGSASTKENSESMTADKEESDSKETTSSQTAEPGKTDAEDDDKTSTSSDPGDRTSREESETSKERTTREESETSEDDTSRTDTKPSDKAEESTEESQPSTEEPTETVTESEEPPFIPSTFPIDEPTKPTAPAEPSTSLIPQPTRTAITFPYEIPGTDIVIRQFTSYNGYYIEDVSDDEISNVATIVLENKGGDKEFIGVAINQETVSLAFSASDIPSGARVVVQEQTRASFTGEPCYSCTASYNDVGKLEMSEDKISITENGDGTFTVKNISDETLSTILVYFKNYLPEENAYVGGVTYRVRITDLPAGASFKASASHYDSVYSRIVKAVVE